jgi:hypothetical protein
MVGDQPVNVALPCDQPRGDQRVEMEIHPRLLVLPAGGGELRPRPTFIGVPKERFEQATLALLGEEPVAKGLEIWLWLFPSDG